MKEPIWDIINSSLKKKEKYQGNEKEGNIIPIYKDEDRWMQH